MVRRHAWVHPDQSKTKKTISVPLNDRAIEVLQDRLGAHPKFVFTYKGNSIEKCSTRAWSNALERAGIENFRWHDLGIPGQVGMCKMGRVCRNCNNWVDGPVLRWFCDMRIYLWIF
jgi:hypothetical protein